MTIKRILYIRYIDANSSIPYMYIRNDMCTYIAPYNASDIARHTPFITFDNRSKFADNYRGDFEDLLGKIDNNRFDYKKGKEVILL